MSIPDPGASSITVAVRVRPFTIREAAQLHRSDDGTVFLGDGSLAGVPTPKLKQSGIRSVIKVVDDRCLVFDPPEDNPVQKFSKSVVPNGKKVKDQVFAFDRVFDDNTTQNEVYEGTTKNLLDSVLDGYNATVFAYGATGCGKTHTITGTAQMPGIIFLTMQELFEKISERSDEKHTEITLSYLEIYNETIRDLLVPGGSKTGLMLREDANAGVTVSGLTSHHPKDVQEVMDMIVQGNEWRTVSPTEANATSSRSHAVLQINVTQKDRNAAVNEPHTMATLSIIDLAGSERASATKNRGERLMEGANINKSLLALGSCINALCDPRKSAHVPYRNSKLTRLLKFSLGGNCKTVMIVCISPSSVHFDETQNTLRYANRAKNIQTKVTRNVFNVNRHVKDFLVKIDEQMALINDLRAQQKDSEKIFFAKFQKQMEKRDVSAREGVQRIRLAYEHSAPERQDKVNHLKKLRCIERRIGLLSSWIAAFDTVCDAKEDEDCLPGNFAAMRKTAQGILLELENSRYHLHQKLEKTNWERAIDTALQHSITQLPTTNGAADSGEVSRLQREAELLKSNFARDSYREVLEQDKAGDAGMMQVLLTAQFEIMASLSETMHMDEQEAITHAKSIINRMLDTGFSAASHIVKPEGGKMPVERFSPSKRGTPKRKKAANLLPDIGKPIPIPALEAPVEEHGSPVRRSPRRRKAVNPGKGVSFTPVKKKSQRGTPKKFDVSPDQPSPEKSIPPPVASAYLESLSNEDNEEESSPSLLGPEISSIPAAKPNRFQAGFLSKGRTSSIGTAGGSPVVPKMSLSLAPSEDGRTSPLRDLSQSANIISPPTYRRTSVSPKPSFLPTPSFVTSSPSNNENRPPSGPNSDSETSLIDTSKLRSALHATKRRDRLSIGGASNARRVSSIGSLSGASNKPTSAYTGPLASATNGISRLRRGSSERRRSPPITCSPSDLSQGSKDRAFTPGQARRMGFSSSLRGGGGEKNHGGSPASSEKSMGRGSKERDASGLSNARNSSRRITIGGSSMLAGGAKKDRGLVWR
ncbi:Kinesin-like protein 5 [Apiospora rasikravindrae]|uniref:Kinesin-like protein 5 n=1 Tax=Apiospora rasikravindrae TaxID=990691 RepID=A0ABR1SJX3_9PEZI